MPPARRQWQLTMRKSQRARASRTSVLSFSAHAVRLYYNFPIFDRFSIAPAGCNLRIARSLREPVDDDHSIAPLRLNCAVRFCRRLERARRKHAVVFVNIATRLNEIDLLGARRLRRARQLAKLDALARRPHQAGHQYRRDNEFGDETKLMHDAILSSGVVMENDLGRKYNAVNRLLGYNTIGIHTPGEVLVDEL